MASNTQRSSVVDKLIWIASVASLVGAGYANAFYGAEFPALYRFMALLVLFVVVLFALSTTVHGKSFLLLARDARQEMRKVVWPNRNETLVTSGFVVVVVIVFSLILWAVDSLLRVAVSSILG